MYACFENQSFIIIINYLNSRSFFIITRNFNIAFFNKRKKYWLWPLNLISAVLNFWIAIIMVLNFSSPICENSFLLIMTVKNLKTLLFKKSQSEIACGNFMYKSLIPVYSYVHWSKYKFLIWNVKILLRCIFPIKDVIFSLTFCFIKRCNYFHHHVLYIATPKFSLICPKKYCHFLQVLWHEKKLISTPLGKLLCPSWPLASYVQTCSDS